MTPANWIAVTGIVVALTVPLIVAYLHRKQMRQIEAFRLRPSVGLIPPPHPVSRFLKKYALLVWITAWSCSMLVDGLFLRPWPSRLASFEIVLGCASLLVAPVMHLLGRLVGFVDKFLAVFEVNLKDTDRMLRQIFIILSSLNVTPGQKKTLDGLTAALSDKRETDEQQG